jgi:hypothetical protein
MTTAVDPSLDLFSLPDEHQVLRVAIRALTERGIVLMRLTATRSEITHP